MMAPTPSQPGTSPSGLAVQRAGAGTPIPVAGPRQRLTFMVPGEPVPKARPRVVAGHTYTPARTVAAEARVREYLKVAYPSLRPSVDAYAVTLEFQLKGIGRGDWDNYAKLICDALNGVVWEDDHQIRRAEVRLRSDFADPCTIVTIEALP